MESDLKWIEVPNVCQEELVQQQNDNKQDWGLEVTLQAEEDENKTSKAVNWVEHQGKF